MINKKLKFEAEMLHKTNKLVLKGDGHNIHPLVILKFKKEINSFEGQKIEKPTKLVVIGPEWTENDKHTGSMEIGRIVSNVRNKLECVVFGSDTWVLKADKNYDFEKDPRPSEHPDRQDALLTIATLPTMKNIYSITETYKEKAGVMKFGKPMIQTGPQEGYAMLEKIMGYYGN